MLTYAVALPGEEPEPLLAPQVMPFEVVGDQVRHVLILGNGTIVRELVTPAAPVETATPEVQAQPAPRKKPPRIRL